MFLFGSARLTLCQQTASSTQTDDDQRRVELVNALERAQTEVRAGRKYIDGLKDQIKSKESQIDAMNARDVKRVEIETSLQAEIDNLRSAVAAQKSALKVREDEVDYAKKQIAKLNKKLKSSHTREKVLGATTAVLFFLLLWGK